MSFDMFSTQFTHQLQGLSQQIAPSAEMYFAISCLALIFARTLAMILVVPFLGSKVVPTRIKVLLAMLFTGFLYPVLAPSLTIAQFPGWGGALIGILLKEVLVGFAIGLVAAFVFYGIQAAIFSVPHFQLGDGSFLDLFIRLSADVLVLAARLSAPVIIAILLADVVLGIANKVAPSINVFELGFSIKGVTGVLVVYIAIMILYDEFQVVTKGMVAVVRSIFKLFAH